MACNPLPEPFKGRRTTAGPPLPSGPLTPLTSRTLMGWNQVVRIDGNTNLNLGSGPLRVTDYNIGVRQEGDAPDYVTGRQDRTAWMKGPIVTEGDLTYPFTPTFGIDMFAAGAGLVYTPQESFSIQSSAHPKVEGCKINTVSLSCTAGEEIQTRATVWGIIDQLANDDVTPGFEDPAFPGLLSISSADGNNSTRTVGVDFGNPDGVTVLGEANLRLEQILQWDVVEVFGAPEYMHVVGFSVEVNNNLVRNYTMGDHTGASPFGLNATSITANQRRVTGTLQWQSNMEGTIAEIVGVGVDCLIIRIHIPPATTGGADRFLQLAMNNVLWNAEPPSLTTGDRVVVETSFTALGTNVVRGTNSDTGLSPAPPTGGEFDALLVTLPNGSIVGD